MHDFDVTLHGRPRLIQLGPIVQLRGLSLQSLHTPPTSLTETLGVSFEHAGEALSRLPMMLFEPDGSFVWSSDQGEAWQVDGMLYDREGHLVSAHLKGSCEPRNFDLLLQGIGWPGTDLVFHMNREGVLLDEGEFRRLVEQRP